MPTICQINGIMIMMYLRNKEHNPPHVHAIYNDFEASFLIASGELLDGVFPSKAQAMVKSFIEVYRNELEEMWETGIYAKLPPLE